MALFFSASSFFNRFSLSFSVSTSGEADLLFPFLGFFALSFLVFFFWHELALQKQSVKVDCHDCQGFHKMLIYLNLIKYS